MKNWTVLIFFVLMALPFAAYGQEDNQPIPACSSAEIIEVALDVASSEVLDNVAAITERIADALPSDWGAIIVDLDESQTLWWVEVVPELPPCSFAAAMGTTVGKYLDEMLVFVSMTQVATSLEEQGEATAAVLYTEIAAKHAETLAEYADKVSELVEVISPFF